MSLTKQKLEMFRGDTQTFDLVVTNPTTGAAVPITGWTFWMTVKDDNTEGDVTAIFQVTNVGFTITDGPGGLCYVTIAANKTDSLTLTEDTSYYFDVQGVEAGGAVHTVAYGTLKVRLDTTRSVA